MRSMDQVVIKPRNAQRAFPEAKVRAVPALARGFALLRYLAQCHEPVGVHQCARAVGIVPSSCLHILRALVAEDAVAFDPLTKRYSLGIGLLSLGASVLTRNRALRASQAEPDRIAAEFGVTVLIARIVDVEHSTVVAISHSPQPLRFNVGIGSRYPTLIGASGRCFAAWSGLPRAQLVRRMSQLRWASLPDRGAWETEIDATRARGYAVDTDQYILGATVLAVPVLDEAGQIVSTVAAVGLNDQVARRGVATLATALQTVAARLAPILGSVGLGE